MNDYNSNPIRLGGCCGGESVISNGCSLTGYLKEDGVCSLTGYLNRAPTLYGTISIKNCGGSDFPIYDGAYEVTPRSYEQVLDTDRKLMLDDVTVHQIPYYETSNTSGITAYIGGEL